MAAIYGLTHSYATYTACQSFAVLASLCWLMRTLLSGHNFTCIGNTAAWLLLSLFLLATPIAPVFSVILTDSSGVIAGLAMALCILHRPSSGPSRQGGILYYSALLLAFSLALGFRLNGVTTLPAFLLLIFGLRDKPLQRRVLETGCMGVAICIALALPRFMNLPKTHPEVLGWTWELVGMQADSRDPELAGMLDTIGNSDAAIARYNLRASNGLFYGAGAPFPAQQIAQGGTAHEITREYFDFALKHPAEFLRNKLSVASNVLGIAKPLIHPWRGVHFNDGVGADYGVVRSSSRELARDLYGTSIEALSWLTLRPVTLIALSIFVLLLRLGIDNPTRRRLLSVFLVAVTYYAGFLVNTQAMEFRYFAPAFFLLGAVCLVSAAIAIDLCAAKRSHFERRVAVGTALMAVALLVTHACFSESEITAARLSDENWVDGVNAHANLVVFENRSHIREKLEHALWIIGRHGIKLKIIGRPLIQGDWITVTLADKALLASFPQHLRPR
jgi:hypothetical protein